MPAIELPLSNLPGVADLPEPPRSIFAIGDLPRGPRVAIVGTRAATSAGTRFTHELAASLARRGVAILSGGAEGIDAAAHRGALEVGGVTVVVGPSSFDRPFPEKHRELFERVVESGGAYVSRYREGVAPRRPQFFARNALMVALSHVVCVVETGLRGGARNAAKWARRLGRPLLVAPGAPWAPRSRGCIAELRAGARLLVSDRDVLEKLAGLRLHAIPPRVQGALPLFARTDAESHHRELSNDSEPLTDRERVLAILRNGPAHPDEICLRTSLPIGQVRQLLLTLTLEGALATLPAGKVGLTSVGID